MNIRINPEYAELVPPLSELEYNSLKESIKNNDGIWHPITVNWDGVILDGHHRYRACQELNIKPTIELKNFSNSLDEKLFVINSNLKRRQLTTFQKIELVLKTKPILQEIAKQRMLSGKKLDPSQISDKGRTDDIIANNAGTSRDTVRKVEYLLENAPAEKLDRLRHGKTKISKEYQRVQKAITKQELVKAISCSNSSSKSCCTNLILCDIRELSKTIPDESIDLIFTDPPYAEKYMYLYQELLNLSERLLKQGGSLIMYAPNRLDIIFQMIANVKLNYADIIAVHQNGSTPKLWKYGIWAYCKFLIWCYKGNKPTKFHDLSNFIESQPVDKHNHPWEQSTIEVIEILKALTLEGMTILDPFMGSGTTGLAALKLNRKFIGIEISPLHYSIAQQRLSAVKAEQIGVHY